MSCGGCFFRLMREIWNGILGCICLSYLMIHRYIDTCLHVSIYINTNPRLSRLCMRLGAWGVQERWLDSVNGVRKQVGAANSEYIAWLDLRIFQVLHPCSLSLSLSNMIHIY